MIRSAQGFALLWLLVTIFLFSEASFARSTSTEKNPKDTLASVPNRLLMQQIMDAWATLNPVNAGKYYDKSRDDVFFDDAGGVKFVGWQAYQDGIREAMKVLQKVKWTVNDDAIVHRVGNYAWGTATVHTDMTYKSGSHQVLDERWTLIWIKRGQQWLIVHEHFSAPLEMQK